MSRDGLTLTLAGPTGERPVAPAPVVEITPPAAPGVYSLRRGPNTLGEFAVHFQDESESDLTTRGSGHLESAKDEDVRGVAPDTLSSWPVLAAIALALGAICGDWYVLGPGRRSFRSRVVDLP